MDACIAATGSILPCASLLMVAMMFAIPFGTTAGSGPLAKPRLSNPAVLGENNICIPDTTIALKLDISSGLTFDAMPEIIFERLGSVTVLTSPIMRYLRLNRLAHWMWAQTIN